MFSSQPYQAPPITHSSSSSTLMNIHPSPHPTDVVASNYDPTRSSALSFDAQAFPWPNTWTPCRETSCAGVVGFHCLHKFVSVPLSSEEANGVVSYMQGRGGEELGLFATKIYRFQNIAQVMRFQLERTLMDMETPGSGEQNHRFLFHCTGASIESIANEGLDLRLSNIGLFGKGLYFADDVRKANDYSGKRPGPEKLVLLCKVVLGRPYEYATGTVDAKLIKEPPGYHSVVGKRHLDSHQQAFKEYVVYHNNRVLPLYAIYYERSITLARNPLYANFNAVPNTAIAVTAPGTLSFGGYTIALTQQLLQQQALQQQAMQLQQHAMQLARSRPPQLLQTVKSLCINSFPNHPLPAVLNRNTHIVETLLGTNPCDSTSVLMAQALGVPTGGSPPGIMSLYHHAAEDLPEYPGIGTYRIVYAFQAQNAQIAQNSQAVFEAYLPANQSFLDVVLLLGVAFSRGLLFKVCAGGGVKWEESIPHVTCKCAKSKGMLCGWPVGNLDVMIRQALAKYGVM